MSSSKSNDLVDSNRERAATKDCDSASSLSVRGEPRYCLCEFCEPIDSLPGALLLRPPWLLCVTGPAEGGVGCPWEP